MLYHCCLYDVDFLLVETVAFQAHLFTSPSVAVGDTVVFDIVRLNQGSGLLDFINLWIYFKQTIEM